MSITSIQPSNTICYFEKPAKPLGPPPLEQTDPASNIKKKSETDAPSTQTTTPASNVVNTAGETLGRYIDTSA